MNATEEFEQYLKITHPRALAAEQHFIKLLLEAIREGGIKQIQVKGTTYEVYADVVETEE